MGGRPSRRSLDDSRREHRSLSVRLADLERLAATRAPHHASPQRLRPVLDDFLSRWGPRLLKHLELETRMVGPRVGGSFPDETGTLETFEREREDFAELLRLLGDGRDWLDRQEPGAEAEIAAVVRDLSSLWEKHVRRVDILAPLLTRLEGPSRA